MKINRLDQWVSIGACVLALAACKGDDDDTAAAGTGAAGMGAAMANAAATIAGFSGGTVTGTATFTQSGTDVTIVIALANCPDGEHPVHVHEGTSCADAMMQGGHWGANMTMAPVRGEMIPNVTCTGMMGTVTYTRPATTPELAWTVGGAAATNVVGHAFVVHNNDMPKTRIGCGVIAAK